MTEGLPELIARWREMAKRDGEIADIAYREEGDISKGSRWDGRANVYRIVADELEAALREASRPQEAGNVLVRDRETGEVYSVALKNAEGVSLNLALPNGVSSRWVSDELFRRNFERVEASRLASPPATAGEGTIFTQQSGTMKAERGPVTLAASPPATTVGPFPLSRPEVTWEQAIDEEKRKPRDEEFVSTAEYHSHVPWCKARGFASLNPEACTCDAPKHSSPRLAASPPETAPALVAVDPVLAFVQETAAIKICEDDGESKKCNLDSGPFCGHHLFDDWIVKKAREALAAHGSRPTGRPEWRTHE